MNHFQRLSQLSVLLALIVSTTACAGHSKQLSEQRNHIEDVSSAPIKPSEFHQEEPPLLLKRFNKVESMGDCAPKEAGGMVACINNEPCRGSGVMSEKGTVYCRCFGIINGCSSGQRCDEERLMCVDEASERSGKPLPD